MDNKKKILMKLVRILDTAIDILTTIIATLASEIPSRLTFIVSQVWHSSAGAWKAGKNQSEPKAK